MSKLTPGEWSLLVGLVLNAAVALYSSSRTTKKLDGVAADILKVEKATNSMKDALVETTRKAALLEGRDEGRAEGEIRAEELESRRRSSEESTK